MWVDLEMTGLDPTQDVMLEVAAEITDFEFNTLASYEAIVQQPSDIVADRMQKMHGGRDIRRTAMSLSEKRAILL
ncbi:hypothetical protein IPL68_03170 [Candidatus Saccharibacteria bacterium]|nr:MAG: hypothetical protein IPL68_03170 [Candidatus Saccharibacteria bacterium]